MKKAYKLIYIKSIYLFVSGMCVESTKRDDYFSSRRKAENTKKALELENQAERKKTKGKYQTFNEHIQPIETIHIN